MAVPGRNAAQVVLKDAKLSRAFERVRSFTRRK
jgi:hypothetical protein